MCGGELDSTDDRVSRSLESELQRDFGEAGGVLSGSGERTEGASEIVMRR